MNQDTQLTQQCEDCVLVAALYALGTLSAEKASAMELRLRSGCPLCTAQTEHYAAVAEFLALSAAPVEPRPELRQRLLDTLKANAASEITEHRKVVRGNDTPWVKMLIPGVEMRPLLGEKTFLLRMQPGAIFPAHDHPQAEQCYVLEGTITDSDGLTLHAGDFVVMSRGIQHDPIRSAAGCTLLISYAD